MPYNGIYELSRKDKGMRIWKVLVFIISLSIIAFAFVLPHRHLPNIDEDEGEGDGSVQAYYINLDKAEDRRNAITPLLSQLEIPFERIAAIYGKDLPQAEKDKVVNRGIFRILMQKDVLDGEIGCYLSHLKTWKEFLKSKASYALIFEDDVLFKPVDLRELVNLLIANSDKWDCVNLDPHRPGNGKVVKQISSIYTLQAPSRRVWNASCYLINREAAASLIRHALPIRMPLDHLLYRSWELGYKFRTVAPKIVGQIGNDTYIQQNRNKEIWFLYLPAHIFRIAGQIMTIAMEYVR